MYRRTVTVLDLTTGQMASRDADTRTLDVPADFDRTACVASVDMHARAHYLSTAGTTLINSAFPRPLSWRIRGETCLVARARATADEVPYRLCTVDPETK